MNPTDAFDPFESSLIGTIISPFRDQAVFVQCPRAAAVACITQNAPQNTSIGREVRSLKKTKLGQQRAELLSNASATLAVYELLLGDLDVLMAAEFVRLSAAEWLLTERLYNAPGK